MICCDKVTARRREEEEGEDFAKKCRPYSM